MMKTKYHFGAVVNAKAQRRKAKPVTENHHPGFPAPWRLGVLALNSVRAALLAGLVALLPASAHAQAIEAWVQNYGGPGNVDDLARALTVDASGNVFVTGKEDYRCVTLAYSSTGVPLWTNRTDGFGRLVMVDSNGDVLVAGTWFGSPNAAMAVKYSSAGVPLWTNLFSSSGGYGAVADADDNFIVAGGSNGDYLTFKCSNAGALLWAKTYNGPGNGTDTANAVAVDPSGNVFVTGESERSLNAFDSATIKYSGAGVPLWIRRCGNGMGKAIAVDPAGDVYVTGYSLAPWDFLTIKYSGAGVPLWTNRYNGLANGDDRACAIKVDPAGDVIVTGYSSFQNCVTIKYSSGGAPIWTNVYSRGDPWAMAVDAEGDVYITGIAFGNNGHRDCMTIAISSAGVPLWSKVYSGLDNEMNEGKSVAVDANHNVYVTGSSRSSTLEWDWVTVKYATAPRIIRHPLSCTNAVGSTTCFTARAAGSTPLTYQWRSEGTNLVDGSRFSGVSSTNLIIANVQPADAAAYTVVVTNAYGSTTSSVAQLTVINPGRFTDLSYSPVTGFGFTFRDGTVGTPYRIQTCPSVASNSWVDWMSFNYFGPMPLMDMSALGTTNKFYRAISP